MPLFRRPRDHRDEFVAGALVGAVVIVLGYASGIGAPGAAEATAPPPSPPATTAPPASAPGDSGAPAPGGATGGGMSGGMGGGMGGGWTGQVPVGTGELPVYGDTGTGTGSGAPGHTGHAGQGTSPTLPSDPPPGPATPPTPTPSGPPATDGTCADGEVRLVTPLLTGITQPVFGLLNGTDTTGTDAADNGGTDDRRTPEPTASPCVGLAPLSALLGGSASSPSPSPAPSPSASPLPEATP